MSDDCGCDGFGPLCDDCAFYAAQDGEADDGE